MRLFPVLFFVAATACLPKPAPNTQCAQYSDLCVAHLQRGDTDGARAACEHALEWSDNCPDAHNNLGLVEELGGQQDKAKAQFIQALRLDPDHLQAHTNLGRLLMKEQQYARACDAYLNALEVYPDDRDALLGHGVCLTALKRWDEADSRLRKLLLVHPQDAEGHYTYCALLAQRQRYTEAASHCEQAQTLSPGLTGALQLLGAIYVELGDWARAAQFFELCLDRDASHPQCLESLRQVNAARAAAQSP